VVDGVLYTIQAPNNTNNTDGNTQVVALDAATGRDLWKFDPSGGSGTRARFRHRGVTVHKDRVFVTYRNFLWAIDRQTGKPIDGFVAPAWLYGDGAREALVEAAIPLAEDHLRVWSPASGAELAWGPVITWASRTRTRLLSSLFAAAALRRAPLEVLRIGVHPPDVRHPALVGSIEATFTTAARRRRPGRYGDLLN